MVWVLAKFGMGIGEQIFKRLSELPPDKQMEVLDFVESLKPGNGSESRRSLRGLWKGLNIGVTDEEIREVRREISAKFPRDLP